METVNVTLVVGKESKEVVDLIDAILEKVMAKAKIADYVELFDELTLAINGVQNVSEEMKDETRSNLAGYLVAKLMNRLAPVKAEET